MFSWAISVPTDATSCLANEALSPRSLSTTAACPFSSVETSRGFRASFSPDGRFIAYASEDSGTSEIYVRPFATGGSKQQVSHGGGRNARWSTDGTKLYYVDPGASTLNAAEISLSPGFRVLSERTLLELPFGFSANVAVDAAANDRFLVVDNTRDDVATSLNVVTNFPALIEEAFAR